MGLDMYLTKKTYIGFGAKVKSIEFISETEGQPITTNVKPERVQYIIEEIGYWRKVNAIHKWFVDNVQHGEDDCKEYYVSKDQIMELLSTTNTGRFFLR
jgi:hypothetical protein